MRKDPHTTLLSHCRMFIELCQHCIILSPSPPPPTKTEKNNFCQSLSTWLSTRATSLALKATKIIFVLTDIYLWTFPIDPTTQCVRFVPRHSHLIKCSQVSFVSLHVINTSLLLLKKDRSLCQYLFTSCWAFLLLALFFLLWITLLWTPVSKYWVAIRIYFSWAHCWGVKLLGNVVTPYLRQIDLIYRNIAYWKQANQQQKKTIQEKVGKKIKKSSKQTDEQKPQNKLEKPPRRESIWLSSCLAVLMHVACTGAWTSKVQT